MEGAELRGWLPYAEVRQPETIASDEQLAGARLSRGARGRDGGAVPFPGPAFLSSATPPRCCAGVVGEHDAEVAADPAWRADAASSSGTPPVLASEVARRVLDGTLVLDFTGSSRVRSPRRGCSPTRARVVKIERRDAMDFGNRRGGLSGNPNRGKQSVVLNPRRIRAASTSCAASARIADDVDRQLLRARHAKTGGLDLRRAARTEPDVIAVAMSGFGLTGQDASARNRPHAVALLGFRS